MKNEAGEYIEKRKMSSFWEYTDAIKAVNLALEQVGKEAKEKLTVGAFKVIESSPSYQDGFVDALKEADEIIEKIIKTLKL